MLSTSDAVHSIKVTVQITEQLSRHLYSEQCQIFKTELFTKRIMLECSCAARNFSRQGRCLWNYGTPINISSKTQERESAQINL